MQKLDMVGSYYTLSRHHSESLRRSLAKGVENAFVRMYKSLRKGLTCPQHAIEASDVDKTK